MAEIREVKNMYVEMIQNIYPHMHKDTIASHVSRMKCSYKEFYEDLKQREENLEKAQKLFVEAKGKDLKNLKEFRNDAPNRRNEFLSNIFVQREQIPPKNFADKVGRVIKQWENQADVCTSCIHYDIEKKFCNYLDVYTVEDFYCKALEKED